MNPDQRAQVVLILRCYVGFALFLPLGVGKLVGYPAASSDMVDGFRETVLGTPLMLPPLYLFAYALPFLETLGALALLTGWQTRRTFLGLAWLLVALGFGTTLEFRIPTTADNLIFVVVCLAGYLLADGDRYGISGWRRRGMAHKSPA